MISQGRYNCAEGRTGALTPTSAVLGYLRDSDCTLLSKFLFGFFAGVGVGQVGVKIFIQDLRGLFAEITPLAPNMRKQTIQC